MISKPFTNNYEEQILLIDPSKPIRVYRNLNASPNGEKGCWSVKQGVVKFHCRRIYLKNVKFIVNEKIRLRVVKNKRKEVHAFVMGEITDRPSAINEGHGAEVYYNPYKHSTFVCGTAPIYQSVGCLLFKHRDSMCLSVDLTSAYYAKTMNMILDTHEVCDSMCETVETHLL